LDTEVMRIMWFAMFEKSNSSKPGLVGKFTGIDVTRELHREAKYIQVQVGKR